jgi:hypothetical protein
MLKIFHKVNAFLPSLKNILGLPIAGIYLLFASLSFLFPIFFLLIAFSEGLSIWPFEISLTFYTIYIVASICMVRASLIWWKGFKKLVAELKNHNNYFAFGIIASLLEMMNKFILTALALPGFVTLFSCAVVFNDIDYYALFKEFGLDFLISKNYYPFLGVKFPIIAAFLLLLYASIFAIKFLSESFELLVSKTKDL